MSNIRVLSWYALACLFAGAAAWISHAAEIQYRFPVQPADEAAFSKGGHSYPGIDIFCRRGSAFVAPVSGVIEDMQRNDEWDGKTKDPEKKGGKWVSLLGDDGFRYYGSHLERVSDKLCVGHRMKAGDVLGYIGNSGNAKGTQVHLHFGISRASAPYNWKTRRGEIEPYYFLRCVLRKGCDPQSALAGEEARTPDTSTGRHQP